MPHMKYLTLFSRYMISLAICLSLFTFSIKAAVVTSIRPLGFIAQAIADGVAPVDVLVPNGASEHGYALRPDDRKRLEQADLVVFIGPNMETYMKSIVSRYPAKKKLVLSQLASIKPLLISNIDHAEASHSHEHHHDHGQYDLHLWLSPTMAEKSAVAIYEKLVDLMPMSKEKLSANLKNFQVELAKADKKIAQRLAPVKHKGYFVFHNAYRYFEMHYGLASLGYFTVNPDMQPGAKNLQRIKEQLHARKASCVFAEPQFRPAVIDAAIRGEPSVRKGTLDPLGTDIPLKRESYPVFLENIAQQFLDCLK